MANSYNSVLNDLKGHKDAIRRNEELLAENPVAYKQSLKRFAIFGYVLYAMIFASAIACVYAWIWLFREFRFGQIVIYFGIFTLVYLYGTIAALFVRFKPSFLSLEVSPEKAPELWSKVNQLSAELNAPQIDRIYLDFEMNASALQWPRYGLFGKIENILTIGIPLMMAMDEPCLRTVIAHEFGHFAGEHGKQSGFVYRSGQLFGNLYTTLAASNNWAMLLIRSIINSYYPKLVQKSLPVSRINEYEADKVAVSAVGAATFRQMMIKIPSVGKWFNTYVGEKVITSLPKEPVKWMADALRNPIPSGLFESELAIAINESTDVESTHPCLNDRLAAQQIARLTETDVEQLAIDLNSKIETTAFEALLNAHVQESITLIFDPFFVMAQADFKEKNPNRQSASIESLHEQELEEIPAVSWTPLEGQSADEQYKDIMAKRLDLGEPSFRQAIKGFGDRYAEDPLASFYCSMALAESDRPYAIQKLESIHMNPSFAVIANQVLVSLHSAEGNETAAAKYYEISQWVKQWLNYHGIALKSAHFYNILPPNYSPMQLEEVKALVAADERITAAYLCMVQKKKVFRLKFAADIPILFIDCLTPKQAKWRWTGWVAGPSDEVRDHLQEEMHSMILVIPLVEGTAKWFKRLQKPNSAIKIK
jgi:Zn-dependent protease with chaperone function